MRGYGLGSIVVRSFDIAALVTDVHLDSAAAALVEYRVRPYTGRGCKLLWDWIGYTGWERK